MLAAMALDEGSYVYDFDALWSPFKEQKHGVEDGPNDSLPSIEDSPNGNVTSSSTIPPIKTISKTNEHVDPNSTSSPPSLTYSESHEGLQNFGETLNVSNILHASSLFPPGSSIKHSISNVAEDTSSDSKTNDVSAAINLDEPSVISFISLPSKMAVASPALTNPDRHPNAHYQQSDDFSNAPLHNEAEAVLKNYLEDWISPSHTFEGNQIETLHQPLLHQSKPRRHSRKRKAPKQQLRDEIVSFPSGFEHVLQKAVNNEPTESSWEAPPRRRHEAVRRCETKVMLQTADGHVFNKYYEVEDIREFANQFKVLRCEYGFSQSDVGATLGRRYGSDFSQTTISRFEGLVLSHSNMCKLRPPIEQWIEDVQSAIENGIPLEQLRRASKNGEFWPSSQSMDSSSSSLVPPLRKRRKRTSLDESQRYALDLYFGVNQNPDNAQICEIAQSLDLRFEVVKIWFCNRRQKTRKEIPKDEINEEFWL